MRKRHHIRVPLPCCPCDVCTCGGARGQAAIRIWDAADWRAKGVLEGHKLTVTQLAFSPDDSRLALSFLP